MIILFYLKFDHATEHLSSLLYWRCLAGLVSKYVPVDFEGKKRRITSIDYRPDGQEVLVSYSSDYIYIFDPKVRNTKFSYIDWFFIVYLRDLHKFYVTVIYWLIAGKRWISNNQIICRKEKETKRVQRRSEGKKPSSNEGNTK